MGQFEQPETATQRYRRRAEELRAMATAATSADVKTELMAIARQYETLADDMGSVERWR